VLAFLLIALILSAVQLPAGKDIGAARSPDQPRSGSTCFIPSTLGFDKFGYVDVGGWLGICTC